MTNNPWVIALLGLFSLLGTGGFAYSLLTIRGQRRTLEAKADATLAGAVEVLLGSARNQAQDLDARLRHATAELATVTRKADGLERQVDRLERKMAGLVAMIHDPYMSLDRLRVIVPDPSASGGNGSASS